MKTRLDKLLVDQGHAASRERAQALILAGRVLVNEQRIDKPGAPIPSDAVIRLLGSDLKYVSRGGIKLERALEHWHIVLTGLACIDIGASTGGFTDCMLQSGAASVLAIDTGYGQIAQKLRADPRVTLRERTNARLLAPGEILKKSNENDRVPHPCAATSRMGGNEDTPRANDPNAQLANDPNAPLANDPNAQLANDPNAHLANDPIVILPPKAGGPAFSFLAMDVSFISVTLVLPAVIGALGTPEAPWRGEAVILIKPQFEAGRGNVGKGGIVRDPEARRQAVERVTTCVAEQGGAEIEVIDSPILGMEGNHEYLLHAIFRS